MEIKIVSMDLYPHEFQNFVWKYCKCECRTLTPHLNLILLTDNKPTGEKKRQSTARNLPQPKPRQSKVGNVELEVELVEDNHNDDDDDSISSNDSSTVSRIFLLV